MKKGLVALAAVLGVVVLFGLWFVSAGNALVAKDEAVKSAWSQVENVYQRRTDLIPNLVSTVKGYAAHEKETLESVVQARASATSGASTADPAAMKKFQESQNALSGALSRLLVVVEKYPDLKANENFRDLQSQLEGTENRITVERKRFNEIVEIYNSSVRMFPSSVIAGMKGFTTKPYFEAAAGAKEAPKVQF
jgi:LemA protein